jgi:hypothetical protein
MSESLKDDMKPGIVMIPGFFIPQKVYCNKISGHLSKADIINYLIC